MTNSPAQSHIYISRTKFRNNDIETAYHHMLNILIIIRQETHNREREGGLTHLFKPKVMGNNSVEFPAIKNEVSYFYF